MNKEEQKFFFLSGNPTLFEIDEIYKKYLEEKAQKQKKTVDEEDDEDMNNDEELEIYNDEEMPKEIKLQKSQSNSLKMSIENSEEELNDLPPLPTLGKHQSQHTPLKAQELQENIEKLEEELLPLPLTLKHSKQAPIQEDFKEIMEDEELLNVLPCLDLKKRNAMSCVQINYKEGLSKQMSLPLPTPNLTGEKK